MGEMVLKAAQHGSILLLSHQCFSRRRECFLQWSSVSCGSRSLPCFSLKGSILRAYGKASSKTRLRVFRRFEDNAVPLPLHLPRDPLSPLAAK